MKHEACWLIELELKRIQTYLFAVPRLSVMVGANAIMGETLRGWWHDTSFRLKPDTLPALAEKCGAKWPAEVPCDISWATKDSDVLTPQGGDWQDNVASVAATGVLTQDGGHFEAVFPSDDKKNGQEKTEEFLRQAQELVAQKLPGVALAARLFRITEDDGVFKKFEDELAPPPHATILDLPQAETCHYSGRDPASKLDERTTGDEKPPIAQSVFERRNRSREFDNGNTFDVLGILRSQLLEAAGFRGSSGARFPSEFRELSTQGYIAVVHVDGNSVGKRFNAHMAAWKAKNRETSEDFFASWTEKERFFHGQRCLMRQCVLKAIAHTFGPRDRSGAVRNRRGKVPLRLLMLGGDDLLLVCGAPYGLRFVVALARELRDQQRGLGTVSESRDRLTIGAGVAIVQDSFPFHRAHQLAEQLAESAKRLKSSPAGGDGNVVDWLVTSESWHGDVAATRRRDAVVDGKLVLSGKPYRILRDKPAGCSDGKSLEDLVTEFCLNYRMSPLSAALGLAQLPDLDEALRRRRHAVRAFARGLAAIDGFAAPPESEGIEPAYHNVMVRYTASDRSGRPRAEIIDALRTLGVPATAGPTRTPLHLRPPFPPRPTGWYPKAFRPAEQHPSWSEGACPNAERRCAHEDLMIESQCRWQAVPVQRIAELIRAFDQVASGT